MVDIQSATAKMRRGKKETKRRKKQDKNIISASAMQGGHNNKIIHYTVLSKAAMIPGFLHLPILNHLIIHYNMSGRQQPE